MKEVGNTPVSWNNLLTLHTRLSSQLPGVQPIKWQWAQIWQKSIPRPLHPSIVQVHHEQSAKPNNQYPFSLKKNTHFVLVWNFSILKITLVDVILFHANKFSHLHNVIKKNHKYTFICADLSTLYSEQYLVVTTEHFPLLEYMKSYKCVCMSHVLEMYA